MTWYNRLFGWRNDAAMIPEVHLIPEEETRKLFRGDSFENEMTGLGGDNDLATASVLKRRRRLPILTLDQLYSTNGYVKRFIDIVPDQATRKGWQIVEHVEEDDKADERLLEAEEKTLGINAKVGDALRWARLYGGSIILIVNEDEDISEPMDQDNPGEIINLVVFDRCELSAMTWNDQITSDGFREVETWSLTPTMVSNAFKGGEVHRSRVIYFPGSKVPPSKRLERDGFDDSVLESVYDQIVNKTVLDQQMARLSHDSRIRVLKLRGLDSKGLSDTKTQLIARAKLFAKTVNLVGVAMLLEGEEFISQVDQVSGWSQLDDKARQALSAVTGIPQTLLFGDSPSGLNTDGQSGRNNFGEVISGVQNHLLRPQLEHLYRILLASIGKQDVDWSLEFNPIFEVTEKETADVRKIYTEIDGINIDRGVYSPEDVAQSRYSIRGWQNDISAVDMGEVIDREALLEAGEEPTEEIPDAAAVAGAAKPDDNIQATALNGAQQISVQGWVTLYTTGQIPRESAVSALIHLSGLTRPAAEAIVPPSTFTPAVEDPANGAA